jgi:hypothetical protein
MGMGAAFFNPITVPVSCTVFFARSVVGKGIMEQLNPIHFRAEYIRLWKLTYLL